jgi:hypothetical protein
MGVADCKVNKDSVEYFKTLSVGMGRNPSSLGECLKTHALP